MSAIGGILYFNNRKVNPVILNNMSDSLIHRGPDKKEIWHSDNVGLFNNLLNTSCVSSSNLNNLQISKLIKITADCRLDNRQILSDKLGLKLKLQNYTDSDLILISYKKWGKDCVKHLLGDFVFAIWDETKKELFCARDHFGVKPIIYYFDQNLFIFSSEVSPLFCEQTVKKKLNKERIADFIEDDLEGIDKVSTFFRNIFKIPPATSILIKNKKLNSNKYWQLEIGQNIKYKNSNDYLEAFEEIFTLAVERRLKTPDKVGLTLSGGLDSSSIAVISNKLGIKNNLQIVSATLGNGKDIYEKPYVEDLINFTDMKPNFIDENYIYNHKENFNIFLKNIDNLFDVQMNLIIPICMFISQNRINVLNFGVDGDLITSQNITSCKYPLKYLNIYKAFKGLYGHAKYNGLGFKDVILDNLVKPYIPQPIKIFYKNIFKKSKIPENITNSDTLINDKFAESINLKERYEFMYNSKSLQFQPNIPEYMKKHYEILNEGFVTAGIERYNRVSSKFGIESRFPFFDIDLIQFCLSLPLEYKIGNGKNKEILRNSMKNYFPKSIFEQIDSYHLGPYYQNTFLEIYNKEIEYLSHNNFNLIGEYFDTLKLKQAYELYKSNKDFENYGFPIWKAFTLDLWLKNNFN